MCDYLSNFKVKCHVQKYRLFFFSHIYGYKLLISYQYSKMFLAKQKKIIWISYQYVTRSEHLCLFMRNAIFAYFQTFIAYPLTVFCYIRTADQQTSKYLEMLGFGRVFWILHTSTMKIFKKIEIIKIKSIFNTKVE